MLSVIVPDPSPENVERWRRLTSNTMTMYLDILNETELRQWFYVEWEGKRRIYILRRILSRIQTLERERMYEALGKRHPESDTPES